MADIDCDDQNACTIDTCVNGVCQYAAGNAGAVCRPAVAGGCDVEEVKYSVSYLHLLI